MVREDGIHIQWYSNGEIKSKAKFTMGNISGLRTEWYENGQKKEEGTLKGFGLAGMKMEIKRTRVLHQTKT